MLATREVAFPAGERLRVLEHRAATHDFAELERANLEALAAVLKPGMTVFDVGTEHGEFAAFAARIVGDCLVHCFEPTPRHWPSIRATFEANGLTPGGCWPGFVADRNRAGWRDHLPEPAGEIASVWPVASTLDPLVDETHHSVVIERPDLPAITLDTYTLVTGYVPDVITIDVEGAEVLVLEGARDVLETARPVVHVSVHPPDFLARFPCPERIVRQRPESAWRMAWGCEQEQVFRIMAEHDYVARFISHDHETHWQFVPAERL